ncbi:peroxynitrite isomerase THAP4 [Gastrophryne carolinensis]
MVICCAAPNCTNRQGKGKKGAVSFHRFPLKDSARLYLWMSAIRRSDWTPGPYSFLCSDHFSLDSFIPRMPDQHSLLRPNAVPSLFKNCNANRRKVSKDNHLPDIGKRNQCQKNSVPCPAEEKSLQEIVNKHGLNTTIVRDDMNTTQLLKSPTNHNAGEFIYSLHSYSRTSLLENVVCVNGPSYPEAEASEMTYDCVLPEPNSSHLSSVVYNMEYFLSEVDDSQGLSCYIEVTNNTELTSTEKVPFGLEVTQADNGFLESCEVIAEKPSIYIKQPDNRLSEENDALDASTVNLLHSYCSTANTSPGQSPPCLKTTSSRAKGPCEGQSDCSTHVPPLNPIVEPLAWMLGTWVSDPLGEGEFPSIPSFRYKEEAVISHVGQPMLNFMFCASHPETSKPMHRECGFIRLKPGTNQVAFICAQNTGMVEVEEGEVQGEQLTLTSCSVNNMSFSKAPHVQKVSRTFRLTPDGKLEQIVFMATDTQAMAPHLRIAYKKVTS